MKTASNSPRPYLINRAGGTQAVKEFSLTRDQLKLIPEGENHLTGFYHLVYRCAMHENTDIKLGISSDGNQWTVVDKLPADEDYEVCYPASCDHGAS